MKIRVRLTLFGALVVAAAVLVFGLSLAWLAERAAPRDQANALGALAEGTVDNMLSADPATLVPTRPPVLIDVASSTEPFVLILDEAGLPLYATADVDGAPPQVPAAVVVEATQQGASAATYSITDTVDIHVEARAWQRPDLEVAGVVVAGQSTAFIAEQVDGLRAVIFVSLIITLLVSLAAGWIVSGRALRPLRSLAETTDEIGATGDLTRRLPPSNADDEVGALTASFNAMLERLQAARTELTESLRRQQQFVADASHELRSPLTTIRNNAGFLAERADASAVDRRDAVAEIGEESDRMARLVDDLLALARTDGDLAPDRRPLDLSALTRDVVGRSDINLEAPDPVEVNGDRDALHRLIVILIENARRHGSPPVEIAVRRIDSSGVIEVRDHGPGLRIDEYDRVFDRFYQADSSRNREGAGLGLAIAREIVMAHQGAIAASNHPGGGAVFSVRLPAI